MIDQDALDSITDAVFDTGLKVIAGAEDRPLVINGIEIPAYVLEGEIRVLSERGFLDALDRAPGGRRNGDDKLPRFLAAENLRAFISPQITAMTNRVKFQPPHGGPPGFAYRAKLLPEVCNVYLRAREDGALRQNQMHIAERAEVLIRGLAIVGVVGLVDEATGYDKIRAQRALAQILEQFIDKELNPWTRTFDFEFYHEMFRLRGWGIPEGTKRPRVVGKYTNDLVYARIAPGVLEELQEVNPPSSSGRRPDKHHQWFTRDIGHPKLKEHLAAINALMRSSSSWRGFMARVNMAFPKLNTNLPLLLEEDED